jgi:transcription termination factor NusB
MNIKARIVARKIVFCYFFEQYFVALSGEKSAMIEEINKIALHMYDSDTVSRQVEEVLNKSYYEESDEEIAYLIKRFFEYQGADEPKEVVPDRDYLKKMAPCFRKYEPIVRDLVNAYTVTFSFDQMDVLDRVIFVLWYAEYKEMQSPKEVVINEMVEFWKRYGDESSFKLINGIAHKLFTPSENTQPKVSPIDLVVGN